MSRWLKDYMMRKINKLQQEKNKKNMILRKLKCYKSTDVFWKLQRYMHDPLTWKLYTNYGVHQVSSTRRHDIFMFTEKDYPLTDAVMILMLSAKLQVDEDCEMARDLVMKIFMEANKPKSKRSLDTSSKDEEPTKKRVAEEILLQESFKKLRAKVEVSGSESTQKTPTIDPKEMSKEDVQNMLQIVPVSEFKVEALQMWRLVKEKFSTSMPIKDKEKALWVELKRLYKPNAADVFWKLQRYMHDPLTWKLYTNYGVHQVSSTRRHDIFMFTEKDYPLTDAVMILMLSAKLQVDEDCEMARDLVMKIFMEANKPKSKRSLDTSSK
nr:hypothetical protein [Tanacetum cinerariifolium]